MAEARYRYSTHKASKHRMEADETPEHKYEVILRRNILVSKDKAVERMARCSCGWRDDVWLYHHNRSHARWERHLAEALRQGRLEV